VLMGCSLLGVIKGAASSSQCWLFNGWSFWVGLTLLVQLSLASSPVLLFAVLAAALQALSATRCANDDKLCPGLHNYYIYSKFVGCWVWPKQAKLLLEIFRIEITKVRQYRL